MAPTLIRMKDVLQRVALSKTEVYRRIKVCSFPKQVRLGPSRIAFIEVEIDSWIQERSAERQQVGENA